jgi:murein DD-endopeptidase MepM/ murein hydrolase activator NlpD
VYMRRRPRKGKPGLLVPVVGMLCIAIAVLILALREDEAEEVMQAAPPPARAEALLSTLSDTLRSGESLYVSLTSKGLNATNVMAALEVLGGEVNLRSCKPGDSYTVTVDEDGEIEELSLRKDTTKLYKTCRDSAGYVVELKDIPMVGALRRVSGTVETSLWEAFLDLNEDPQIALKLADVLGWEIDFVTDTRQGDTFTIIVEEWFCEGMHMGIGDVYAAKYTNKGEEYRAFRYQYSDGNVGYFNYDGKSVKRVFLKSPLNYRRISSYFTSRRFHPILKVYRPHYGVDYAAPSGTPVVSIGDGAVTYAGWNGGMGNYVEVRHNGIYSSCYGHLSRYGKGVKKGRRVAQGQVIGYVGTTGLSTGPHLDFRIKKHGSYVNPLRMDFPRTDPVPDAEFEEFASTRDTLLQALNVPPLLASTPR